MFNAHFSKRDMNLLENKIHTSVCVVFKDFYCPRYYDILWFIDYLFDYSGQ